MKSFLQLKEKKIAHKYKKTRNWSKLTLKVVLILQILLISVIFQFFPARSDLHIECGSGSRREKNADPFGSRSTAPAFTHQIIYFTVLAGACELPEAAEVLCAQRSEASAAQAAEEALPLPLLQGDQVLPVHQPGLGGGGPAGLPPGIQHAQPAHPQVRLGFFSS